MTYHGDDLLLDERRKGDELEEEGEVELEQPVSCCLVAENWHGGVIGDVRRRREARGRWSAVRASFWADAWWL